MKGRDIFLGLAIALTMAIFSFLASPWPDGLKKASADKNFAVSAKAMMNSPIPNYLFPGVKNEKLAASLAGVSGVLVVFVLGLGLGKILKHR